MNKPRLLSAVLVFVFLPSAANSLAIDISSANINGTIFVDDSLLNAYPDNPNIRFSSGFATSGFVNVSFPAFGFNETYDLEAVGFGNTVANFSLSMNVTQGTSIEIGGNISTFSFVIRHNSYILSPGFYDHDNNPFTDDIYEGPTPGNYGPLLGDDWYAWVIWADGVRIESYVDGPLTFSLRDAIRPFPIPPAIWLFGSGLLGLIGVGRRRA